MPAPSSDEAIRWEGVTTAATLWFVTVIGLCFGGGQYGLGFVATVLAVVIVAVLKKLEAWILPWRRGKIIVTLSIEDERAKVLDEILERERLLVLSRRIDRYLRSSSATLVYELRYSLADANAPSRVMASLSERPGVERVGWEDAIR